MTPQGLTNWALSLAVTLTAATALAQDGAITGTVKLKIPPDWQPKPLIVDKDKPDCCRAGKVGPKETSPCHVSGTLPDDGLRVDPATGALAGVVVWLTEAPAAGKRDWSFIKTLPEHEVNILAEQVTFDQKFCRFMPHVLFVPKGWKVLLASQDPVAHNTHTYPFANEPINVSVPAAKLNDDGTLAARSEMGPVSKTTESERTPVKVTCDIHPWMTAYWVIMDHPYYTVTNANGEFTLQGLPPGEYTVKLWHEKFGNALGGTKGLTVTVEAGKTATLTGIAELDVTEAGKPRRKTKS